MANTSKKKTSSAPVDLPDVVLNGTNEKVDMDNITPGVVQIDDNALVNVRSNTFGKLIYIDQRNGEQFVWPSCGTVLQLTYGTLRNMKATAIGFYKNQWIVILGFADSNAEKYTPADIYQCLMITKYYQNLVDPSDYEEICSWSVGDIPEKISLMTRESKANLVVALNTYIEHGVLDSIKKIKAFEDALGCELSHE